MSECVVVGHIWPGLVWARAGDTDNPPTREERDGWMDGKGP